MRKKQIIVLGLAIILVATVITAGSAIAMQIGPSYSSPWCEDPNCLDDGWPHCMLYYVWWPIIDYLEKDVPFICLGQEG